MALKEDDITKMLAAETHLGETNGPDFQMAQYVFKVKSDGTAIINLKKTWEKLLLAARVIAAIENPADVCVLSNRTFGQRAVLKFAAHTGAVAVAGRFTPGTFTNQIQAAFKEPRLLVVSDPRTDHQSVTEASYVNIPVIALCNTNSPLKYIDIAIPCNNNGDHSLGLMWWMLAREVLRLRGTISRETPWEVMPDLYFYRDPEEVEHEEELEFKEETTADQQMPPDDTWGVTDKWQGDVPPQPLPTTTSPAPYTTHGTTTTNEDWNVGTKTEDWGAEDTGGDWGNTDPTTTTGEW